MDIASWLMLLTKTATSVEEFDYRRAWRNVNLIILQMFKAGTKYTTSCCWWLTRSPKKLILDLDTVKGGILYHATRSSCCSSLSFQRCSVLYRPSSPKRRRTQATKRTKRSSLSFSIFIARTLSAMIEPCLTASFSQIRPKRNLCLPCPFFPSTAWHCLSPTRNWRLLASSETPSSWGSGYRSGTLRDGRGLQPQRLQVC